MIHLISLGFSFPSNKIGTIILGQMLLYSVQRSQPEEEQVCPRITASTIRTGSGGLPKASGALDPDPTSQSLTLVFG